MTRGGEFVSPLNIPAWRDFALRDRLEDLLGLRVQVDGDARALALAEGAFGGARNESSYVSMVVSTGVGGAIVLDGRLLDGETGNAGHMATSTWCPRAVSARAVATAASKLRRRVGPSRT